MATIKIEISGKPFTPLTMIQVHHQSGRSESQISQTVNRIGKGGESPLDHCYPFPYSDAPEHAQTGPKLIVPNEKYDKWMDRCKQNKLK